MNIRAACAVLFALWVTDPAAAQIVAADAKWELLSKVDKGFGEGVVAGKDGTFI